MLKVLYLPLGDQPGTCDAFNEIGVNLEVFNFLSLWERTKNKENVANNFLQIVKNFQPDLIHTQIQFSGIIEASTFKKAKDICPKAIITNWTGDCRAIPDPSFIRLSHACDYSLISSTGQIPIYENAGCKNLRYWQIGYSPKVYYPKKYTNFKYDISFIGNHYGSFPDSKLRYETCFELHKSLNDRAGIFGAGYSFGARTIDIKEGNEIYNQSICALSISHFNNVSHYFSDRLLYCLASGRPTISWHFPGYEDYFVDGKDIFIARSKEDIFKFLNFCKQNPEEANKVGENGWRKVFHEHTFTSKIIELLNICNLQND